jgi:DNA-binding beta-propeller fold protein YncE
MAAQSTKFSPFQNLRVGRVLGWLLGIVSMGLLLLLLVQVTIRFTTPGTLPRLQLVKDVALPSVISTANGQPAAKVAVHGDRFDFQALDAQSGLLFAAHPGPGAGRQTAIQAQLPANTQFRTTIVVFNTRTNEYLGSIDVSAIHGITVAPDLHRVYAAGFSDKKVYVIDVNSCKAGPRAEHNACNFSTIPVNQPPDGIEYDADNQQVFVAEPAKTNPTGKIEVINALTNRVTKTLPLNGDIGHVRYDTHSHQAFAVILPKTGPNQLAAINPINYTLKQIALPGTCSNAHGLALDSQQEVAFIACVDSQKVVTVNLQTMQLLGNSNTLPSVGTKPDILVVDAGAHVLYVASVTSVSVFDESGAAKGSLVKIGDYVLSSGTTHTIALDEASHNIYLPLTDVGGQPIMRIEHYDPRGVPLVAQ